MKEGRLIVISGPSGAGKGTVIAEIMKEIDNTELSISMTTRPKRKGEVDGEHYHFASEEEFRDEINQDGFLEYALVYGNFYGTPKKKVLEKIAAGKNVILEIDVQGAMQIMKNYPKGLFLFILPPSMKELKERIVSRGTDEQRVIDIRMKEAVSEILLAPNYNFAVINDDLHKTVEEIKDIINDNKKTTRKEIEKLIEKYKEEISC